MKRRYSEYPTSPRPTRRSEYRGIGLIVRRVETMRAHFGPRELRPFPTSAWKVY
jgi:hypothetical protein